MAFRAEWIDFHIKYDMIYATILVIYDSKINQ